MEKPSWFARLPWITWPALLTALGLGIYLRTHERAAEASALEVPDSRMVDGDARLILSAVAILATLWAVERIATGTRQIGAAQFKGDAADREFNSGLGALIFGVAAILVATTLGSLTGFALWLEEVTQSDWIENNFEVQLAVIGAMLVVAADWVGRMWVAAGPATARVQREFQVNVYSMTFASVVGVIVFVVVGSSAFAARLAQVQVEVRVGGDSESTRTRQMGMERVQFAANRISEIDAELRRIRRNHALLTDRRTEQMALISSYENDLSADVQQIGFEMYQLEREYIPPDSPSFGLGPPSPLSVALLRRRIEASLQARSEAMPPAVAAALDSASRQLASAESAAPPPQMQDATRRAVQLGAVLTELRSRYRNLLNERGCVVDQLAYAIAPPAAADSGQGREGGSNDADAESRATYVPDDALYRCPPETPDATARAEAERLIDAVLPLRRTWMSEQLAKRTPISLSIELVVVMGALGALLRLASARLQQVFVRPTQFALSEPTPEAARANETTLLTLGLQIVFGMATALALFILLNVTINAASDQLIGTRQDAANLNPFTMAGLGLLGGFAALNVADWMGKLSRRILEDRAEDDGAAQSARSPPPPPAQQPPPPAQPPAAPPPPGV